MTESEFDEVSANYEKVLSRGISLSGENSDYFASNRVSIWQNFTTRFLPSLKR